MFNFQEHFHGVPPSSYIMNVLFLFTCCNYYFFSICSAFCMIDVLLLDLFSSAGRLGSSLSCSPNFWWPFTLPLQLSKDHRWHGGKESACQGGWCRSRRSDPWVRKIPGGGNGTPTQYCCLENPRDGGAWWAPVHGVAKSRARLSDFTFTFYFHALEKEMATHSSILAWRIPGTEEPSGLLSMGSHRVGHDWSDSAAAAAAERKYTQGPQTSGTLYRWLRLTEWWVSL